MPVQKAVSGNDLPDGDNFNIDVFNTRWADKIQSGGVRGVLIPISFTLAQSTPATTGVNKTPIVCIPFNCTIIKAYINAKTAPTGQPLIVDINKNGTSIWDTTQANRLRLLAAATSGIQTSFDTVNLVEADLLTIDVDQIGSGTAGQDITVILVVRTQ